MFIIGCWINLILGNHVLLILLYVVYVIFYHAFLPYLHDDYVISINGNHEFYQIKLQLLL